MRKEEVYQVKASGEQPLVFGEQLSAGVYIIEVRQGDVVQTVKAVKEYEN